VKNDYERALAEGIDFCVGLFTGYLPFKIDAEYRKNIVAALVTEYKEQEKRASTDNV
jgi:hypothetical protein